MSTPTPQPEPQPETTISMPPGWTIEEIEEMLRESMFGTDLDGVCCSCGNTQYGVEPDAEGYKCEDCGAMAVCGPHTLMFSLGGE